MRHLFIQFVIFLVMLAIWQNGHAQSSPAAIFKGDSVYMLKKNQLFKDSNLKFFTGDTDNPTSSAKDAASGSLYFQADTSNLFIKQDSGSSTNWSPLIGGTAGLGTNNCVVRWDGTATPLLQDSLFCIDDLGVGSGLTALSIDNLSLDANTIAATGDLIFQPSGNINLPTLTVSNPLKLDASGNVISQDIALTTDVSGVLPIANGGTNNSTALIGNYAIVSSGTQIGESATITTTELGYLDNVSSSIQTQLDGKQGTGLGDGRIWIGDGSNVAQPLIATGDVVISNAGVTSISSGVIVDGDISASAAITSSKIALPNANAVAYGNSSSALTNESTFTYNDSTDVLSLTGQANVDNLRLDGNTLNTTSGGLTLDSTTGTTTIADDLNVSSSLNVTSGITGGSNISLSHASALIRKTNDTSALTLLGGSQVGSQYGGNVIMYGISHATAGGDVIISAGSGSGEVEFKANGSKVGDIDQNGQWEIGTGGGSQTHLIHGNLNGSGSGQFTGSLIVNGPFTGSGSGTLAGNLDLLAQGDLRLQDSSGGEYVAIQANATTTTYTITMPSAQGAASNTLINNGSGALSWDFPTTEPTFLAYSTAVDYTILDNDGYSVIYVTDSSPTKTITLPTVADNTNRCITIINNSTDDGTVTVDGESSETIDGAANISLDYRTAKVSVCSDGSGWFTKVNDTYGITVSAYVADGSSTTTVSEETKNFIDGNCTNPSAGQYVCTFISGFWKTGTTPHCIVTGHAGNAHLPSLTRNGVTNTTVFIYNPTNSFETYQDGNFTIVCHGYPD